MTDIQLQSCAARETTFLWVDLTRRPSSSVAQKMEHFYEFKRVRDLHEVSSAINRDWPAFICVELEACADAANADLEWLACLRRDHPDLPLLVITDPGSETAAGWAVRLRLSELMIKPVAEHALHHAISSLTSGGPRHDMSHRRPEEGAGRPASHASRPMRASGMSIRVSAAISYIARHYGDAITLGDVAAVCRLSRSQFCRTFKETYGQTFGQYLLRYRMERAREQLASPGALIKEVAYAVGFNDHSYFTMSFRREFGLSPSEYQTSYRGDDASLSRRRFAAR
jgi:AraC-like DNA-binding protein/ActR/RegA family two-component response regulator